MNLTKNRLLTTVPAALAFAVTLATFDVAAAGPKAADRTMPPKKANSFPIYESPRGAANRIHRVPGVTPDRLDRGVPTESPRVAANRVIRVPGVTRDLVDRGAPSESPRMSANRIRRVPGITPDRINRGIASDAPKPSASKSNDRAAASDGTKPPAEPAS